MSKKRKLIPEIRFPEFKNEGEWDLKTLEDVLDYERPDKYIVHNTNYLNEGTPVLTANKSFILGYTNEDFGIYKKLPAIIFDDFTVDSKFVNFSFKVKSSAIKILTPKKKYDLRFTYELISQIDFNATEHKRYYISEYQKLKLPFPSPIEQLKIASCLSSLDDLIEAHNQKLDLLKDHKKGLIQNLFPQEGGKMPKYRFKEFEKDGVWVTKKLGQIGEPLMCKRVFKEQTSENSTDGVPFYKIGTFGKEADSYIPIDLFEEYKNKYSFPKIGDVLISASGTIGRLVVYDGAPAFFQDSNIIWLGNDEKNILNSFLFYSYSTIKWQTSDGGIISRLYNSDFKNMQVRFPKDKAEQVKIASCLSSLDALISAQAEKIEQLKKHKKGLMQCLFPKMIE